MDHSGELVVLAVALGLFVAMGLGLWYATKRRKAALVRLRDAVAISAESVSSARILVALLLGVVVTGGSAPLLMLAFPKTPMMFLVSVCLAFAAVLAPLTFARRLMVDVRLALEPASLRLERRGARPMVVDLSRPFTLDSKRIDDEVLVLVEQEAARFLFSYRQGPAFVTLPLAPLPEDWLMGDERITLFGEEAALIHERLHLLLETEG